MKYWKGRIHSFIPNALFRNVKNLFTRAIVRPPGQNFSNGLTTASLGAPALSVALRQHEAYCEALQSCGLLLTRLPPDEQHPDSTFVEDTAVLTARCAIVTRPGAESRRGEVPAIEEELLKSFGGVAKIETPGTLDGGDICEAGNHFFIGISERTNDEGARQLAEILRTHGYSSKFIDIRNVKGILHLKSGIAYLGSNQLVVIDELAELDAFRKCELIRVKPGEDYSANCIEVNGSILVAQGYAQLREQLERKGFATVSVEMSEFQKMDGGLSCLSLRY